MPVNDDIKLIPSYNKISIVREYFAMDYQQTSFSYLDFLDYPSGVILGTTVAET